MIFLTGATGLLGSSLLRSLVSQGERVRAIYRNERALEDFKDLEGEVEWVQGDILDVIWLEEALQGVETVFHIAAKVSFNPREEEAILKINHEGTANVVNASLTNGVKEFCFISSIAALGRDPDNDTINERTAWVDTDYNTPYARSKYLGEMEVFRGQEEGMKVLVVNPSIILGPGNWDESSSQLFRFVWKNSRYYTAGNLNYVDLRDVVELTLRLWNEKAFGERFILHAGHVPFVDFFRLVANQFAKEPPKVKIGYGLAVVAYWFERLRSKLTGSSPLITRETVKVIRKSFYYDNTKVRTRCHFEFKPIEETVHWACNALVDKYQLKG